MKEEGSSETGIICAGTLTLTARENSWRQAQRQSEGQCYSFDCLAWTSTSTRPCSSPSPSLYTVLNPFACSLYPLARLRLELGTMTSFGAPALFGYLEEDGCDGLGTRTAHQSTSRTDLSFG